MAINRINGKLSYAKASDETWTMVDSRYGPYKDITYYKGRFYAVNLHCIVMACYIRDSDNTSEAEQAVAELPPHSSFTNQYYCKFYIVESAGALLIVSRAISTNYAYGTFGFKVFKVDLSSNKCMEIKDLGDQVLFLGSNSSSFSCTASLSNCKPNSIYFTENVRLLREEDVRLYKDIGIYTL
ncbi:hypothetical protein QYF36_007629 [Acer negundo]|nr:hypothetical protein QYF36_007629 [Acer negundo]